MTYLRPDSKSQVTIEYSNDNVPQRIVAIVVSTQHDPFASDEKMMVNDFSDYAKPTQLKPEPIEVDRLLAEVATLYEGGRQNVVTAFDSEGVEVDADPVRLRQVMHNLIKNAVESAGEGGKVLIGSRVAQSDGGTFVEISISDNGPGFDPDLLEQVFEPYVTNKTKGTGLGLAIVKRIVAEHGGLVRAENCAEGGGCVTFRAENCAEGGGCVTFRLPCFNREADRQSARPGRASVAGRSSIGGES